IDPDNKMVEKCFYISKDEDKSTLTSAALSCGVQEASLAFVNKLNVTLEDTVTGPLLTSHTRKKWFPAGETDLEPPLVCTTPADCELTEDDNCITVDFEDNALVGESSARNASCKAE
ncbi:unnamed protein product, partial [Meganyctiphanes norvegica]